MSEYNRESLMEKADRLEREMDLLLEFTQRLAKRLDDKEYEDYFAPVLDIREVKN